VVQRQRAIRPSPRSGRGEVRRLNIRLEGVRAWRLGGGGGGWGGGWGGGGGGGGGGGVGVGGCGGGGGGGGWGGGGIPIPHSGSESSNATEGTLPTVLPPMALRAGFKKDEEPGKVGKGTQNEDL